MPIDLVCGQCQGRLRAEQPGSVVACPHCGTHLHVPEETVGEPALEPELQPAAADELVTSSLESAEHPPTEPLTQESVALVSIDQALLIEESAAVAMDTPSFKTLAVPSPERIIPSPAPEVATTATATVGASSGSADLSEHAMPAISTGDAEAPAVVPRTLFLMVASYASALSLAFVFLLLQFLNVRTHQLESLPDVVPEIRNGEVALKVAPPESNVPPGHVLAIGESRRFGNLNVTPVRVSQGPLQFEHALNDATAVRSPSEPVLKLWLRFENVSRSQHFAPLDRLLLFKRHYQEFGKPDLTNQFVCRADQRRSDGKLHHVFELSATSEFRIAGQKLDTVLGPGEALETFVPSEEQIDDLTGDLVWRVQFRKGYHPRTRHGVTTLIDVPFHRDDVTTES